MRSVYFPPLLAGPIDRASHLLPQLTHKRHLSFQQTSDGIFLILFGLFKKVAIAPASNLSNFVGDGHFTQSANQRIAKAVLTVINQSAPRKPVERQNVFKQKVSK